MQPFKHEPLLPLITLSEQYIDGKRYYVTPTGTYPSVTTVLSSVKSEGLDEWIKNVGEAEAKKRMRVAANRGTVLHSMVETYLKNENVIFDMPDTAYMFKSIKRYLDQIKIVHGLETQVYSTKHKYAGRLDIFASFATNGDMPAIIDIKNHMSDLMYAEEKVHKYFVQTSAYAMAIEEMGGPKINLAVLIFGSVEQGPSFMFKSLEREKEEFLDIRRSYNG